MALSLRWLESVFAEFADPVLITDAGQPPGGDPHIIFANRQASVLCGCACGDLIGRTPDFLCDHGRDGAASATIRQAIQRCQPVRVEVLGPCGDSRWVDISVSPLRDPDGSETFFLFILRDITEQKQALEAQRLSELRAAQAEQILIDAIESMREGFLLFDAERRLVLANRKAREMYGAIAHLMVPGASYEGLLRAWAASGEQRLDRDPEDWIAWRTERFLKGSVTEVELKDGRWFRVSDHLTRNGNTVCIRSDITEMKRHQARVEESEQQLMVIADTIPALIAFIDRDYRLRFANAAHAAWYATTEAALLGRHLSEVVGQESFEHYRPHIERVLAGEAVTLKTVNIYPDGQIRSVQMILRPQHRDEQITGCFIFALDVTEQESAVAQARLVNRAKSEFLANISHELRTPLNAILGFAELIRDQAFGPIGHPKYVEYIGDIHASGQHLLALINDLLDLTRIEAGKLELSRSAVDPRALIDAAVRLMRVRAHAQQVDLAVTLPAELPALWVDERAAKQILLNLLSNAVKFTPPGGIVAIEARREEDNVALVVRDTGIGMTGGELQRIAQPFVQIESALTRRHEGTGIGLYITKSLVKQHGGRITFVSRPQQGTTVTVLLPAHLPDRPLTAW